MNDDVPTAVVDYFQALPAVTHEQLEPVFDVVRDAMPAGYELGIQYGMPGWVVPLERFPDTYNKQPLSYVSLAAGKRYNSLYLTCLYASPDRDPDFRRRWAERGLTLNMGKSCLRYRKVDDLALDLIADEVASTSPDEFIELYRRSRA